MKTNRSHTPIVLATLVAASLPASVFAAPVLAPAQPGLAAADASAPAPPKATPRTSPPKVAPPVPAALAATGTGVPGAPAEPFKTTHALKSMAPLLPVADLDASIAFYTRSLGFALVFRGQSNLAILQRDGCSVLLAQRKLAVESPARPTGTRAGGYDSYACLVYCAPARVDKLYREFREARVPMPAAYARATVVRDYGVRVFSVLDPDGNEIAFGEALPDPRKPDTPVLDIIDATESLNVDGSNLHTSFFHDVNLAGSQFHGVAMAGTTFEGVDLSKVAFHDIDFRKSKFNFVNFAGASFDECDLSGVTFTNCKVDGLTINGIAIDGLAKK